MNKIVFKIFFTGLLLLATCMSAHADNDKFTPERFDKFLSCFKEFEGDSITVDSFAYDKGESISDYTECTRYLWEFKCINESVHYFTGGYRYNDKGYYVVFITRVCNNDRLMEIFRFGDFIVMTLTPQGDVIDFETIGRQGREHYARVKGSRSSGEIDVVCGDLTDTYQYYKEPEPVYFAETEYKVTISDVGRIDKQMVGKPVIKEYDLSAIQAGYRSKPAIDFKTFKSKFVKLDADKLGPDYFEKTRLSARDGINRNTYSKYIDRSLLCDCEPEGLSILPGFYIPQKKFDLFMMSSSCDNPSRPTYLFNDVILVTTTKDGTPIDAAVISRSGDIWEPNITFSAKPLSFSVKQLSDDCIPLSFGNRKYVISDRGVISEEPLE